MPRKIRSSLDNRTARLKLAVQRKPHAWTTISKGVGIAYRRNQTIGAWVVRGRNHGKPGYWTTNLPGVPDDFEDANGDTVLNYHQACDKARAIGRGETDQNHRPSSWGAAIDAYEADLKARDGSLINASRLRGHLTAKLLASTGTRTKQACGLLVGDLQNGGFPRLLIPSSRKGGKGRKSVRKPVPITATLAAKLHTVADGRPLDAPLLRRSDGTPWNPERMELSRLFAEVAKRVGVNETAYCLRHSSIVRSLIAGTPTRVVAANHDTSTVQLERVYSAFISDHSDAVSRKGLLDTGRPAQANVVALAGRQ